ncbi:MAG TPA: LLM class F420-dependent oxidoreductase [Mycobacterium sp.]|nr:LLM class F420-dependent oxidoreductase [Mycobacterium sp.]
MKLSMLLTNYAGDPRESAALARRLEDAGLDIVWIPEAYGFDAISQAGYIAAQTSRIEIATGIVNVYSRTPSLLAMTAAGVDILSEGRFVLGLGASGPQVIEGFHGLPYKQPLQRIKETIEICRRVWERKEPLQYDGKIFKLPLSAEQGSGLGKPLKIINHPFRSRIPVYWASLMDKSLEATAEVADGWLPVLFIPEAAGSVFGPAIRAGLAKRQPGLSPLQVVAGGPTAVGENLPVQELRDKGRKWLALYVGGMGARGKNFYNELAVRYGYEEDAVRIQDLYLDGKKTEAEAAVPDEWLFRTSMIGPRGLVEERIAAYAAAGVTHLSIEPVGPDPVKTVEAIRKIVDNLPSGR